MLRKDLYLKKDFQILQKILNRQKISTKIDILKKRKNFLGGFLHLNFLHTFLVGYFWALTMMATTSAWLRRVTMSARLGRL